ELSAPAVIRPAEGVVAGVAQSNSTELKLGWFGAAPAASALRQVAEPTTTPLIRSPAVPEFIMMLSERAPMNVKFERFGFDRSCGATEEPVAFEASMMRSPPPVRWRTRANWMLPVQPASQSIESSSLPVS